jgi:hypothetical protein
MPNEAEIDIPDAWRYAVHPRRPGMAALASAAPAGDAVGGKDLEAERERILAHSGTDPALAALARSGEPSVAADAVRLALAPSPLRETFWHSDSLWPVEDLVAARGLAHAVAAFVASCAYFVPPGYDIPGLPMLRHSEHAVPVMPLLRYSDAEDNSLPWQRDLWDDAARHLRSLLAVAPQDEYDDAIAAVAPLRDGLFRQRIAASYLMPDRRGLRLPARPA